MSAWADAWEPADDARARRAARKADRGVKEKLSNNFAASPSSSEWPKTEGPRAPSDWASFGYAARSAVGDETGNTVARSLDGPILSQDMLDARPHLAELAKFASWGPRVFGEARRDICADAWRKLDDPHATREELRDVLGRAAALVTWLELRAETGESVLIAPASGFDSPDRITGVRDESAPTWSTAEAAAKTGAPRQSVAAWCHRNGVVKVDGRHRLGDDDLARFIRVWKPRKS
jgi:hypothetical protein